MKIIVPTQVRDLLDPQLPDDVTAVWVNPEAWFEGDPADYVVIAPPQRR